MKIETKQVTQVALSELDRLDPIRITLEDIAPRQGRIVIECYGKSWASYWGGMGNQTISDFFCSCNTGYLIGNLAPSLDSSIVDYEGLPMHLKKQMVELKKDGEIKKEELRELFEEADEIGCEMTAWNHADLMERVLGDEWYRELPTKPNEEYQYLKRIVEAVQEGLGTLKETGGAE